MCIFKIKECPKVSEARLNHVQPSFGPQILMKVEIVSIFNFNMFDK